MPLSFSDSIQLIASLENKGWRLGLDRMQAFVSRIGIDHWPKFIHIAGTNGKGSVTAFVQSLLIEQGWRTGACFSPFVYDVRERVQFFSPKEANKGSSLIPREDFARLVEEIWPVAQEMETPEWGGITEFEFKTAMGFKYWSDMGADFVALEVGLGGRLDATNIIDPAVSVIVSIGFDHTEHLGETEAKIAIEKAGIIKPGRPAVVGETSDEAWLAIETIAKVNQSMVWRLGREIVLSAGFDGYRVSTPGGTYERLSPGLTGFAQPHNMALAIAAVEAAGAMSNPRRVPHGVAKASAPGRMQWVDYRGKKFLLDGAHNGASARVLVESLLDFPGGLGSVVLLTGMLEGHNPGDFYDPLSRMIDSAHFVPIDFHRARTPESLMRTSGWLFKESVAHATLREGLESVLSTDADVILVTGSFYLVGEVGRLIGAT